MVPEHPDDLHEAPHVPEARLLLLCGGEGGAGWGEGGREGGVLPGHHRVRHQEEGQVVGRDRHAVNHVHGALDELDLLGRSGQPHEELDGEVGDADCLHHRQLWVVHGLAVDVLALGDDNHDDIIDIDGDDDDVNEDVADLEALEGVEAHADSARQH